MLDELRPESPEPEQSPARSTFTAGRAVLVLIAWITGQLAGAFLGAIMAMIYLLVRGVELQDATAINEHLVTIMMPAIVLGTIAGAVAMIGATLILARPFITATDETGIGWSLGSARQLALSAFLGAIASSIYMIVVLLLDPQIPDTEMGPISRLVEDSMMARWVWAFIALAIAPVTEEFLFRGVLFSGLANSWGIPVSASIVSALFLLFHFGETAAFWPSTVAIGFLTVGTIAARLITNRLGPPIAMHLAYNAVLVIMLLMPAGS